MFTHTDNYDNHDNRNASYEAKRTRASQTENGSQKIETTLIYTQLLNLNDDEWTCKTASNINEATALIEAGFEYVTKIDGTMLFRKRK
jgi:hypothetical protein